MTTNKRKHSVKKQKPSIFYQTEVFIKGVHICTKTFSTKKEALLWSKRNKYTLTSSTMNDQMKFKDCVKRFREDIQCRVLKSTFQAYESPLEKYIYLSPLAKLRMSEFKGIKIVEWIQWLKNHPTTKNTRRKSFTKEIDLLVTILNWYKNFLNEDFNIPITKKHKQMRMFKPIVPRQPDYFIKPEDAREWINWLSKRKNNPVYWKLASFMLLTGARISEACGLKWEAIDFETSTARIIRRVRWDHRTKHPFLEDITKTAQSTRILMLPKKLQDILFQMKEESSCNLVFVNKNSELLKYNAVQAIFNRGFKALNLPWRSTHILRHSYATMALMGTRDLSAVQASLGHTHQKMTQKYAKAVALLNSDIGEKTSSILFNT